MQDNETNDFTVKIERVFSLEVNEMLWRFRELRQAASHAENPAFKFAYDQASEILLAALLERPEVLAWCGNRG